MKCASIGECLVDRSSNDGSFKKGGVRRESIRTIYKRKISCLDLDPRKPFTGLAENIARKNRRPGRCQKKTTVLTG